MKNLWLCVYTRPKSFVDGEVRIGLFSGKTEEEALENLYATLGEGEKKTWPNYKQYCQVTPVNGSMIHVMSIPTDYKDW